MKSRKGIEKKRRTPRRRRSYTSYLDANGDYRRVYRASSTAKRRRTRVLIRKTKHRRSR